MSLPPSPLTSHLAGLGQGPGALSTTPGCPPTTIAPSQRRLTWPLVLDDLASAQARRAFANPGGDDQQPGRE